MSTPTLPRLVLGCLYAHAEWLAETLPALSKDCFSQDPLDLSLFDSLVELHARDVPPTPIDLLAAAAKAGAGAGFDELTTLVSLAAVETRESFGRRVTELQDDTLRRVARAGVARILQRGDDDPAFDWVSTLELAGEQLRRRARPDTRIATITPDRVLKTIARRKRIIPTGFPSIDTKCGGVIVGKTVLAEARTNVGKSSFLAALTSNQFFPGRVKNIEYMQEHARALPIFDMRRRPGHAQPPTGKDYVAAPHVLLLSVEDDLDDYLGRFIVDMGDIQGMDFLENPTRAIAERGREEVVAEIAATLGAGRLTIADYEHEDGHEDKTLAAIVDTITQWVKLTRSRCAEQGETDPPLLVLLDYFQKINSPEDEKALNVEHRVLAKISSTLYRLAKKQRYAQIMAVMLLRGPDSDEPDHNQARGGSDVTQDADMTWTLWPFGAGERRTIERAIEMEVEFVDFDEAAADENPFDASQDAPKHTISRVHARRAINELLITCDKNRHGGAGWRVALAFDRPYQRITEPYDGTIYRYDPTVLRVLAEARAKATKAKK